MSTQKTGKLNRLLQAVPKGAAVTASRLRELEVSPQLARKYVDSGWVSRLGYGAFARAGDHVDWTGGLYALQQDQRLSVRVAGRTALELLGRAHNVPVGANGHIALVSDGPEHLPTWFVRQPWADRVSHRCLSLFDAVPDDASCALDCGDFTVKMSSAERAILEVIQLATSNAELEHASLLMDGLNTLRPSVVQALLEACRSVKVKRFALWSAGSAGHAWFDRIDLARIDLGRGKRQLYQGGSLDHEYQITVPPVHEELPSV